MAPDTLRSPFTSVLEPSLRLTREISPRKNCSQNTSKLPKKAGGGAINAAKTSGVPVIAVGTTAMRTLESSAQKNGVLSMKGSTTLFIHPPHEFKIADGLITNFHVPKSSLMLLVDAFLKHKRAKRDILALYDIAIKKKFRFYSFGDGMLIL
ncbi:MAG TPA: S-adenosylmethionine:tRNA ribosyltransferase-isomerase [Candidatus Paceibacterota bacterium]